MSDPKMLETEEAACARFAHGSDPSNGFNRRSFLAGCLAVAVWPLARGARAGDTTADLQRSLEQSPLVYVSPLRSDGAESSCHGEVWFGWLDGTVVLITSNKSWKARAVGRGLGSARIWTGDYGRWNRMIGHNEAFREAPHFDARAEMVRDEKLLERLLGVYETKYPKEIARFRLPFRKGFHDGSRVLIRYTPA